ncbi:WD40 repeat-containing protein [Pyrenophora teres f. maculata]|nr:WD40 repeat-containing protein [Pyrenophora teres f. maculata]
MERFRRKIGNKYKSRTQPVASNETVSHTPKNNVSYPPQQNKGCDEEVGPSDTVAGAQEPGFVPTESILSEETATHSSTSRRVSPRVLEGQRLHNNEHVKSVGLLRSDRCPSSNNTTPIFTDSERRQGSSQSTMSKFASITASNGSRTRSNSEHRRMNPLGLTVIHEPEYGRSLDIIFVHGLGGSSHSTWSKNHDPALFWPQLWLPSEPAIGSARILSFGYDADWKSTSSRTVLNITDFAKELLFAMKFTKNENRDLEDLGLGDFPIIFIVHSMGGLVVKKAYILGQNDEEYSDIVKSVNAIIFLSTPHRGSNLAELLNRILSVSILRYSPKQYVTDLQKNSLALEEINEQFRKFAPKLKIVSFYETLETAIGPKKVRIVEKDSAILGYPGEISRAMNADHHDVCKYYSPRDVNYISIRDVLKTLVDRVCVMGISFRKTSSTSSDGSEAMESLLSIQDRPDDDFNFFHDQWMPGTCEWILRERVFSKWLEDTAQSSILWLNALPATGKSVLSSFIVNHIKSTGQACQFYFFRFGEQTKRSINGCLRSLAFQLSQDIPQFRRRMRDLSEDGLRLEKTDARTVWDRLFVTALLTLRQTAPLYWVIDALDEADSPELLLDLFAGLKRSGIPIKLLVMSRESPELSLGFEQLRRNIAVDTLPITSKSQGDIQAYVEDRLALPRWEEKFKKEVTSMILQRAEGNFLWVHLAIKEVLRRHTSEDIRKALEKMLSGMESMYYRMALEVVNDLGPTDRQLARRILTWAMFSRRALTLVQLEEALRPFFGKILDLRKTITATCGFFVVVDMSENVTMIHQTARDYLTHTPELDLYIDTENLHLELFRYCMTCLMKVSVRSKLNQDSAHVKRNFIQYAATSWSYHLNLATKISSEALSVMVQFLRGSHVLMWIRILASLRQLKVLVYASRTLSELVSYRKRSRFEKIIDDEQKEVLRLWAIDLVKIVGKFGPTLLYDPASIHNFITEFCPKTSMVYRQFATKKSFRFISVSGITNEKWDDSVAHMSVRRYRLSNLLCSRGYIAAVATYNTSVGVTIIWSSTNFEQKLCLSQGEYITACCFDSTGTRYVACGVSQTKMWEIPSGRLILTTRSPKDTTVLSVTFSEDKSRILAASEDKSIQVLAWDSLQLEWEPLISLQESDVSGLGIANSPCAMLFNSDNTLIAVSYRGFPLSVWGVEDRLLIGRCSRPVEGRGFNETIWAGTDMISWNPRYGSILGKYSDGCVFKWDPYEQTNVELRIPASLIQCSPDGLSLATCDNNGVIRIFNYQNFALVYQLRCDASPRAFTFSPDSRRFYEVRDTVCTAWEPPALTDLQETGEQSEDLWETQSDISTLSESVQVVEQEDRITSLIIALDGKFFCAGNEIGEVHLFDADGTRVMNVWRSPRYMVIDLLAWDNGGKHLAIAELGGDVSVKQISPPSATTEGWGVQSIVELKMSSQLGTARQLLFSPDGSLLLLVRQHAVQVLSMNPAALLCQCQESGEVGQHWLNDPTDPRLLLSFNKEGIRRFSWAGLEAGELLPYGDKIDNDTTEKTQTNANLESGYQSVHAYLAQDRSHVVVGRTIKPGSQTYLMFQVSDLNSIPRPGSSMSTAPVVPKSAIRHLPEEVTKLVEVSLGVLAKDRFVFLDQDFWVCTWKIGSTYAKDEPAATGISSSSIHANNVEKDGIVKKHFMLPRHWLNEESLPLLRLVDSGKLYCPKGDEVAVIGTRLAFSW